MTKTMTSRERFQRMFQHREADRVPITDGPWGATFERWHKEGLPTDVDWVEYFGMDRVAGIGGDNSPRYESRLIEETDEYTIATTAWGVTMRNWKHQASTPEFLDFTIVDPDSWRKAKERMVANRDRINWDHLKNNYKTWRERGCWIHGHLWFGYDVAHSWMIGTERFLMAMKTDPEWVTEIFDHMLTTSLAFLDMIWDAGYEFDCVTWPDDMGYKQHLFFSVDTYRELLKPYQKRAVEWAHAHGIPAELHSCGDIRSLVPEFLDIGLDGLNPLEVKAGVDPVALKREVGDRLVLHGGINALLYNDPVAMEAQVREVLPILKENGGYIFSSDHSVPSSISLKDFTHLIELAKELGTYE